MAIIRSGKEESARLARALAPAEEQLKILANIADSAQTIPQEQSENSARSKMLDQQISLVENYAKSNDPRVRQAAKQLLGNLSQDRLALEDPLFARIFGDVRSTYGKQDTTDLGQFSLPDKELRTLLTLAGDTLSDAEIHALRLLEPLMSREQVESELKPKLESSYEIRRSSTEFRKNAFAVASATVLPVAVPLGVVGLLEATTAISPPAAFATLVTGVALGHNVGDHLKGKAMKGVDSFGNNRLEGISVDNDLQRLFNRADDDQLYSAKEKDLKRSARTEAGLVDSVLANYPKQRTSTEQIAIDAFETFASELREAAQSGTDIHNKVSSARSQLRAALTGRSLGETQLQVVDELGARANDEAWTASVELLLQQHNKAMLAVTNPALLRKTAQLETFYQIHSQPDAKDESIPQKMHPADIDALRLACGDKPSVAELIAIMPFQRKGLVSVTDLWGPEFQATLPDGGTLDANSVQSLVENLGTRTEARKLEKVGRSLPKIAKYASTALGAALAFTPAGIPAAIGTMFGTRLLGGLTGSYLAKRGTQNRVLSGVDSAKGRPVDFEGALLLQRFSKSESVMRDSVFETKKALVDESNLIESILRSVNHAQQSLPDQARQEFEYLLAPTYKSLAAFSASLRHIATGNNLDRIRNEYGVARSRLLSPETGRKTMEAVIRSKTRPELPGMLTEYLSQKQQLLGTIEQFVNTNTNSENANYVDLVKSARKVQTAREKLSRKEKKGVGQDALDKLVKSIIKDPFQAADMSKLKDFVTNRDTHYAHFHKQFLTLSPISTDRVEEVGQELLETSWAHVYPLLGTVKANMSKKAPQLRGAKVEIKYNDEGLPVYQLDARIKGGGHLSVKMSAYGEPELSSLQLDLGEKNVCAMAQEALARHLDVSESVPPRIKRAEVVSKEGSQYLVELKAEGQNYRMSMSADGHALIGSLKKV